MSLNRGALLLIEFQNEWLSESGKLNHLFLDRTQWITSLKNAERLIKVARKTQTPIIHSGLSFLPDYRELGVAEYGLRAHIPARQTFLADSTASAFPAPFTPNDNEFVAQGRIGCSAFSGSNLDIYLRNHSIHRLYIMGYALHVCVESTLRAAHDLGYETIIIEDATAAFTLEQKKYFLNEILPHFGSRVSTDNFIASLKRGI